MNPSDRIETHTGPLRAGLIALGAPFAAIGAWALLGPRSWYENFPGGGQHWVSALPPYNEHLVRDFGGLYLGLGFLLVFAAILLGRQLVVAALATLLIFSVPHFIFHLTKLEALSTGDNIANMSTLALSVALPVTMLAYVLRSPSRSTRLATARAHDSTIEGGMTYGTR